MSLSQSPAALPPGPTIQEAEWAPGPFWTDAENLDSTRFRSMDSPAYSESLYRLSYPGPQYTIVPSYFPTNIACWKWHQCKRIECCGMYHRRCFKIYRNESHSCVQRIPFTLNNQYPRTKSWKFEHYKKIRPEQEYRQWPLTITQPSTPIQIQLLS